MRLHWAESHSCRNFFSASSGVVAMNDDGSQRNAMTAAVPIGTGLMSLRFRMTIRVA